MARLPSSAGRRDLLLALGVAGLAQAEVWSGVVVGGPRAAVAATGLVMGLVLAWRRPASMTVLMVVFAAGIAQALLGVDSNTFFTPLLAMVVAVSSAAYHARRPILALLAALGLVWVAVLIENGRSPGDLLFAGLIVGGVWLAGHAVSIGQVRSQLLEQRAAQLEREATWLAAAAVAKERVRIARELHDVVAHSMSVMTLHVGGVRRMLRPEQGPERAALLVVERTGREALEEMHRLLGVLREPHEPVQRTPHPRLAHAGELLEPVRAGGLAAELRVEDAASSAARRGLIRVPNPAGGGHQRPQTRRRHPRRLHDPLRQWGDTPRRRRRRAAAPIERAAARRWARIDRDARTTGGVWRDARRRTPAGARLPGRRSSPATSGTVMTTRVLLADDQEMVRAGLRLILAAEPDIDVVAEASDGNAAVAAARRLRPDVTLMDIRMPNLDGIEATRQLLASTPPPTRVVVLTTFDIDSHVYQALRAGRAASCSRTHPPRSSSTPFASSPPAKGSSIRPSPGG